MTEVVAERYIEGKVQAWAEKNGWLVRKLSFLGRRSAPDRLYIRESTIVFIEFKRSDGVLTKGQEKERDRLRDHGALVYCVRDIKAGVGLLKIFM